MSYKVSRKKALGNIYWWTKNHLLFVKPVSKKQIKCPNCGKRFYKETGQYETAKSIHKNIVYMMAESGIYEKDEKPIIWLSGMEKLQRQRREEL